ncbi:MAG: hypothetical protein NC320_03115 [Clostridium sp.]|nr:hypothetical protein [Clostridium sp.]
MTNTSTKGNINLYAMENVASVVSELERYGYLINATLNGESIGISVTKPDAYMPDITIKTVRDGKYLYLTPTLKFPELTRNEDDYADFVEYQFNRWADLGKYITEINRFVFDFDKWQYDAETDEWYY